MTDYLTTYYNDDHWSKLALNQREWYVPTMIDVWRDQAIYRPFVPMEVDLAAQRTKKMHFNLMWDLEPNTNASTWGAKWVDNPMVTASAEIELTTEHHLGKIMMDKEHDMVTYWNKNGAAGLLPIIRQMLAPAATTHMDILARNAFLQTEFRSYAMGGATGFSDIANNDVFDLDWALDVQLRGMTQSLPGFDQQMGSFVCVTTPGTIYAVNKDPDWVGLNKYTDAGLQRLFAGEVGSYKGMRFIVTNRNILWNAGPVRKQVTITAPTTAGNGGYNWGTYKHDHTNFLNYIQLSDFAAPDFAVNEVVTIHTARSSADSFGVANGVNWRDGKTTNRVVKYVDATNNRLGFDRPLLMDYDTDLDAPNGVYGYVTKADRDVHASLFILAPGAVVAGVSMPLQLIIPPAIDDTLSTRRFVYETYTKYQAFRPELAEVVFHAGQHRVAGGAAAF